jgi:hypothetical protein
LLFNIIVGSLCVCQQGDFPELDNKGSIISLKPKRAPRLVHTAKYNNQKTGTVLLLIEPQIDFHSRGPCPVSGAEEDTEAFAELIHDHGSEIDEIVIILDTHQVF